MGAGGNFWNHAAVERVLVELRKHDVRKDSAPRVGTPLDDGSGRFVAARLDAENEQGTLSGIDVRHHLVKFLMGEVGIRVPLEH